MIQIEECVVERRDGPTGCGLVFYKLSHGLEHLSWTVDLGNPPAILVSLYPQIKNIQLVHDHYPLFTDSILAKLIEN